MIPSKISGENTIVAVSLFFRMCTVGRGSVRSHFGDGDFVPRTYPPFDIACIVLSMSVLVNHTHCITGCLFTDCMVQNLTAFSLGKFQDLCRTVILEIFLCEKFVPFLESGTSHPTP